MNLKDKYKYILKFYKDQASYYDLTRWTFLFGRKTLLNLLKIKPNDSILEIGTGTGSLLQNIENKREIIDLTGIDISPQMIKKAKNKLNISKLINCFFENYEANKKYDIIIMAYTLSIIKHDHLKIIKKAKDLLKNGGKLYITDFYNATEFYLNFMKKKEIMIDPNDLEILKENFKKNSYTIKKAFLGIWKFYLFTGEK